MAQAYRRFGSRVTDIETGPRIMSREDPEVADELHCILSSGSMQFVLSAEVTRVRGRSGEGVGITVRTASGERTIEGCDVLVAAGRLPDTADIGLEQAGVDLDARWQGRISRSCFDD